MLLFIAVLLGLCVPDGYAAGLDSIPDAGVTTNGLVNAVTVAGNTAYLGGSFTQLGRVASSTALVDGTTAGVSPFPGVYNRRLAPAGATPLSTVDEEPYPQTSVMIPDGAGGWYIGGRFSQIGDATREALAHVLADGKVDQTFDARLLDNSEVESLALSGGTLYVGGAVRFFGTVSRDGLVAVDAATGAVKPFDAKLDANRGLPFLGASARAHRHAPVRRGHFRRGRRRPAAGPCRGRRHQRRGHQLGSEPGPKRLPGLDQLPHRGRRHALRRRPVHLDRRPAARLARPAARLRRGRHELESLCRRVRGRALTLAGSTVYAGGEFAHAGGAARAGAAALSVGDGHALAWDAQLQAPPNSSPNVFGLAVDGATVYLAGRFSGARGEERPGSSARRRERRAARLGPAGAGDRRPGRGRGVRGGRRRRQGRPRRRLHCRQRHCTEDARGHRRSDRGADRLGARGHRPGVGARGRRLARLGGRRLRRRDRCRRLPQPRRAGPHERHPDGAVPGAGRERPGTADRRGAYLLGRRLRPHRRLDPLRDRGARHPKWHARERGRRRRGSAARLARSRRFRRGAGRSTRAAGSTTSAGRRAPAWRS